MIIVVLGLPGSGKSYFASKLAERLQAEYVSSDKTRKEMEALGRYTFTDKLRVYHQMVTIAGHAVDQGKTVVVDATFYRRSMRDLFTALAKAHKTSIYFIEVTATEGLIKERLSQPRADSEADYAVYQIVRKQFEQLGTPHLTLHSSQNNIELMLTQALNYIKDIHEPT